MAQTFIKKNRRIMWHTAKRRKERSGIKREAFKADHKMKISTDSTDNRKGPARYSKARPVKREVEGA